MTFQTDALFDKIEQIAGTPGKKDKQALVGALILWELETVRRALDPTVSYYIAKLPAPTVTGNDQWGEAEYKLLDDLASRRLTGASALMAVDFSLRELTPKSGELLRRVILKDLRAGFGASTVNKAVPGFVPEFAYMRCSLPKDSDVETWDWDDGVYSQLKANGMFARFAVDGETVTITTRQGNTFPAGAMAALEAEAARTFDPHTETHGELTVFIDKILQPRATGNGMLNSLMQGGEMPAGAVIHFDAWDQIPLECAVPGGKCDMPYSLRLTGLFNQLDETNSTLIHRIEGKVVSSYADAMAHYREILARGLEGTIVKRPAGTWKDGTSKDQVKLKLEVDVDLKIVGFREGEPGKRTAETFGSVLCQTDDGLLEVAVSGFKRDMELWIHEHRDSVLGKIMCVRANEVSPPSESSELHSLFHPRFVELRHDKVDADTLPSVLKQFEAAVAA